MSVKATGTGPTSLRTYTFPDANAVLLTDHDLVTVAQGGTGLATLTAHALYVGAGTSVPTALAVGASNTVLHGNTGANPSFSAVSLTADVTGTLPVANGGFGLATLTAHALYVGNGTGAPAAVAVGATNTVLAGSTGADPAFTSTPTIATLTTTSVAHFGSSVNLSDNTSAFFWTNRSVFRAPSDGQLNLLQNSESIGVGLDFATDGILKIRTRAQNADAALQISTLTASSAGPHAIGGATNTSIQLGITGTFSPASNGSVIDLYSTLNVAVGASAYGIFLEPTFVEAGSGNHPFLASLRIAAATVTGGAATVSDTASLYIAGPMTATVTGANYALWVDAGNARFDGLIQMGGPTSASTAIKGNGGTLELRLADDSTFAPMNCGAIRAVSSIIRGDGGFKTDTSTSGWFLKNLSAYVALRLGDDSGVTGAATASLPAAGSGMDGAIGFDTTLHAFVYYEGGARYKVLGVSF